VRKNAINLSMSGSVGTGALARAQNVRHGTGCWPWPEFVLDLYLPIAEQRCGWRFGVPAGVWAEPSGEWAAPGREERPFTRNTRRSRLEESFPFTTTATQYTGWSVTLHPVAGGTADTEPVPEDAFPDLK
jgi:hypothetical protein